MHRFIRAMKISREGFGRLIRFGIPARRWVIIGATFLGMMFLSCIGGAAILYFDLAGASALRNAFMGYEAWLERGSKASITSRAGRTRLGITRDVPEKTFDGFTLYTTTQGTSAALIDMRGNLVHQWNRPFSQVWPQPTHIKHPVADDLVHWFRCRLFSNGDLLAIYQSDPDTPHGYGLAKLDKDSNILWAYSDNVHHDLDLGDDGKIYALTHQISQERLTGLDAISPPYLADYLVILSAEGKELQKISILEAFQRSPFLLMLSTISTGGTQRQNRPHVKSPLTSADSPFTGELKTPLVKDFPQRISLPKERGDFLHANGVKVLNRAMATKFLIFKEGQVLLSLRGIDALAILDVPSRSIVWAVQGIWRGQHDPEFLENGHLLLFDNSGLGQISRVIEYDPITHGFPWSYTSEDSAPFVATQRGMKQHLPNGNVLIVDPDGGRLFEVNSAKSLVWEYGCPAQGDVPNAHAFITGVSRYPAGELKFLDKIPVRP